MGFIRFRKLKCNDKGEIISGTAAIIDTKYVKSNNNFHSKQIVREKLGKVIRVFSQKKGVFLSPTRGLVIYDAVTDSFSNQITPESTDEVFQSLLMKQKVFPRAEVHTVFGDTYLILELLRKSGLLKLFRKTFPDKAFLERFLCHILHTVLKDGSHISCNDFIAKSFASYLVPDVPLQSLKCDTYFFSSMGEDDIKLSFFKNYLKFMKSKNKNFGNACFVDSTPLPNEIDTPFTALCSHGTRCSGNQMRLVLVLDEETLRPVWYEIIAGNINDINTLSYCIKDIETTLNIKLNGFVLDAGYASKELIQKFKIQISDKDIPQKKYLVRMPNRKGYPYHSLYTEVKSLFLQAKYDLMRNNHNYFGYKKQKEIFGTKVYAYVFVDHNNALKGYSQYLRNHLEEFEKLSNKEKNWHKVKFGYFVLISNMNKPPKEIIDDYFARTRIETFFKTAKEYLRILPLSKWNNTTIRGKILTDIIASIVRQTVYEYMSDHMYSISSMIGKIQSLMCFIEPKSKIVYIDTPNKQTRELYKSLKIKIPKEVDIENYISKIFEK